MPASVEELMALLDLEVIEDNLFRGRQPDTQLQRVFGGQVAAHALVAASRTVPDRYQVHSLHSYFLRPGDTSVPIVYDVESVREGRSFATRRVLARQHGRPIFAMTLNFQIPEEGLDHQDPMPEVARPRGLPEPGRGPGALRPGHRGVAARVGGARGAATRELATRRRHRGRLGRRPGAAVDPGQRHPARRPAVPRSPRSPTPAT